MLKQTETLPFAVALEAVIGLTCKRVASLLMFLDQIRKS